LKIKGLARSDQEEGRENFGAGSDGDFLVEFLWEEGTWDVSLLESQIRVIYL